MSADDGYAMSTQETEAADTEEETEATSSREYKEDDVIVR